MSVILASSAPGAAGRTWAATRLAFAVATKVTSRTVTIRRQRSGISITGISGASLDTTQQLSGTARKRFYEQVNDELAHTPEEEHVLPGGKLPRRVHELSPQARRMLHHRRAESRRQAVADVAVHAAHHQLRHRVQEKVGMKMLEKTSTSVLPRLLTIKKRLGFAIVGRKLARGVAIAIPAVGGVFAAVVSVADGRRALKEYQRGNQAAGACFTFALVWDLVDFGAHVFTAAGLSGVLDWPHIDHHIHFAESLSLVAAVVATASAIAGEVYTPAHHHDGHGHGHGHAHGHTHGHSNAKHHGHSQPLLQSVQDATVPAVSPKDKPLSAIAAFVRRVPLLRSLQKWVS